MKRLINMPIRILYISLFFLFVVSSCKQKENAPDISHIKFNTPVLRFDQDLFANLNPDTQTVQYLQNKYPLFYKLYIEKIAAISSLTDTSSYAYLRYFINDQDMQAIYDETNNQFTSFDTYTEKINTSLRYYNYYFPSNYIPYVITYFFGFNYSVVATDSAVCIALDQYLGKDFKYYAHLPDYIRAKKEPTYLVADLMKGWVMTEFERDEPRTDLLDEIIFQGQIMFLLDHIMPFEEDSVIMGYTGMQLDFCKKNEWQIWSYFIENKLLYSQNITDINKYTGEAPFSAGMPKEAPGRIGIWLGWQIVKAYAKRHPNLTVPQIMYEHDYKKIMNKSNYKPKR